MIRRNLTLFLLTFCACVGFSFVAIQLTSKKVILPSIANAQPKFLPIEHNSPSPLNRPIAANTSTDAIQVALLLDTSGSMDGLIEQAKSQLWNILNELAKTKKDGEEPNLQIALYEYGNPSTPSNNLEIHQLSPFTSDMDMISEKLFSLTTNGGNEYCGAVIKQSLDQLTWNDNQNLKMIYIAGNEPFVQGPVDFREVCKRANDNGIVVNTIFCGDRNEGIETSWYLGAQVGGGDYLCIEHNEKTVYISTPFDNEIDRLNLQLNDTYIPYGSKGNEKKRNQVLQDNNAKGYSLVNSVNRAKYKSSKKYIAEDWDLIDAYKKDKSILKNADIKDNKYSGLSKEELEIEVTKITKQRTLIQS
ncbi:MAG: VWA domain-containing protein, partial [Saprospiraceae bacterium]|nr:VWA domain-containing protein [Saprospiraceae bacterium]